MINLHMIRKIEIDIKTCTEKTTGNSYFAGGVSIEYGSMGETLTRVIPIRFQYG